MRNVGFVGNVGNIFGSFGTKNLFLFDIFYNIEPISVYLKKQRYMLLDCILVVALLAVFWKKPVKARK